MANTQRDGASEARKRSRSSPTRDEAKRRRSRSPRRRDHHHRPPAKPDVRLPLGSQPLHKRDLETHRAIFADYLDIQKHIDIHDLSEDEVKGRWKSFLGKWNRGELAEGWYDVETKSKANARYAGSATKTTVPMNATSVSLERQPEQGSGAEDDEYGPSLPSGVDRRSGPAIPNLQDLQQRRELADEGRVSHYTDLRSERKQDRKEQKERLEELVPRAEPGSRERQLEKKREGAAANRAFRDAKDSGDVEVAESELLGEEGGMSSLKAQIKAKEKHRSEREIRKEEVLRAREAEREERLGAARLKEDKTMDMLRGLAKQRYG